MDTELLQNPAGDSSKKNRRKRNRAKKKAMKKTGTQTMGKLDVNLEDSSKIVDCQLLNDDLGKNLHERDLNVQPPGEKMPAGSTENLSEVNAKTKKKKKQKKNKKAAKVMDEAQSMDQTKMDTESTENLVQMNTTVKRKRRRKIKKKAKLGDEIQSMEQAGGISSLHLSDGNHEQGTDGKPTENECTAQESEFPVRKESSLSDLVSDETKMDTGSTEKLVEMNANVKRKRKKKIKKKAKVKDEIQCMDQVDGILNLHLSDGNDGRGTDVKPTENECTAQESEFSVRKESSSADMVNVEENHLNSCKDEKTVLSSDVVEVSSNGVSSELVDDRCNASSRPMEVEGKFFPCEIQHSSAAGQMAGENPKFENVTNEVNNEIVVGQRKCSAEGRSLNSTCDSKLTTQLSSPHVTETECFAEDLAQYPRIAPIASVKRKLLVLDVNGLLANIVMPAPKHCRGDVHIYGRAIFKRPFCDDFLKFCFENFDVGVWSSRSRNIINRVVDYLLGDQRNKLLFCWDMDHSTKTGYKTLENCHKPLVCKELRRIWENDDPDLPWKKGDYNESNTLLLDDSPYKALLNPLHTAIFPNSYHYEDKNDNSLGPGGDLRVYLEGLLTSDDVQKYVEQYPFGQSAINETNISWGFYSDVLQTLSNRVEENAPATLPLSNRVAENAPGTLPLSNRMEENAPGTLPLSNRMEENTPGTLPLLN